jgi:hypothetical protein
MSKVQIACACGKQYRVSADLVGKRVRCKDCGEAIQVALPDQASEPDLELVAADESPEASEPEVGPAGRSAGRSGGAPRRRRKSTVGRPKKGGLSPVMVAVTVLLLVAVGGGAAMAVTGWRPWKKDALAYVPKSMDMVMGADWDRLAKELELRDEVPADELKEFMEETGIDPFEDIDTVYFAMDFPEGSQYRGVFLIEGDFDINRIRTSESAKDVEEREYKGHTIYLPKSRSGMLAGNSFGILVLGLNLIAVGDEETLEEVVDVAEGAPSILDRAKMRGLIEETQGDLVWIAAMIPGDKVEQSQGLERVVLGADLAENIMTLGATAGFNGEDKATEAEEGLTRSFQQLDDAKAQSAENPEGPDLNAIFVGRSMERSGADLRVEMKIDTKAAKEAFEQLGNAFGGF